MLATSLCALRTGNIAGLIAKMLVPDLKRERDPHCFAAKTGAEEGIMNAAEAKR
jgi:hypothetical protein